MSGHGGIVLQNIMATYIKNPKARLFKTLILLVMDTPLSLRKKSRAHASLLVAAVHIIVAAVTEIGDHLECLVW